MTSQIVIHSQNSINCKKIISQLLKGNQYIKYYNNYLIPYTCLDINHQNRIINGKFINPIWNVIERRILTGGGNFNYSYVKGKDFTLEFEPNKLRDYHIFGRTYVYANAIEISDTLLRPNTILLFSLDKNIAEPLIQNKLI
jgi:hypothetical protein